MGTCCCPTLSVVGEPPVLKLSSAVELLFPSCPLFLLLLLLLPLLQTLSELRGWCHAL